MKTYYEILDVSKNISTDELRLAYFRALRKYHPDKDNDVDTTQISSIISAWKILKLVKTEMKIT